MTAAPAKIRHEWFQTDANVTVDIFIKNLDPSQVTVEYVPSSLGISIKTSDSAETALNFDLFMDVEPAGCKYSVLKSKIEITLKKATAGFKWATLEGDGRQSHSEGGVMNVANDVPPAYPTSSKKDWNKVEQDITNEKGEEAGLNDFFQTLFKDATPEVQMAMKKSFTESNGTCLSTNWQEVSQKKVEVTPPDGMIAKPYEK